MTLSDISKLYEIDMKKMEATNTLWETVTNAQRKKISDSITLVLASVIVMAPIQKFCFNMSIPQIMVDRTSAQAINVPVSLFYDKVREGWRDLVHKVSNTLKVDEITELINDKTKWKLSSNYAKQFTADFLAFHSVHTPITLTQSIGIKVLFAMSEIDNIGFDWKTLAAAGVNEEDILMLTIALVFASIGFGTIYEGVHKLVDKTLGVKKNEQYKQT